MTGDCPRDLAGSFGGVFYGFVILSLGIWVGIVIYERVGRFALVDACI